MTADLVQFLRARYDEDEQTARLITPGGYEPDEWRTEPSKSDRWVQVVAYSRTLGKPPEVAIRESDQPVAIVQSGRNEDLHIARHDPARVLAEVEAKRRLLEVHQRDTRYSFSGCITCDAGDNSCGCMGGSAYEYPCETLRLLALPYAAHPDYRPEWAPEPA